ncbi:MAG: class I SAM-dependent methyltransferase [Sphingopyxis sp.]
MAPAPNAATLTAQWQAMRGVDGPIRSALAAEDEPASYDGMAGTYDRIVGNRLYNRLVWGVATAAYAQAAQDAVADGAARGGAMADIGCGSLVFTAAPYAHAPADRMILADRSIGMLRRAAARLPMGRFAQVDALAMPFADGQFATVMSWGMLHLFGSGSAFLPELRRVAARGARVSLSMLVLTDRRIGNAMLVQLHRRGGCRKTGMGSTGDRPFRQPFSGCDHTTARVDAVPERNGITRKRAARKKGWMMRPAGAVGHQRGRHHQKLAPSVNSTVASYSVSEAGTPVS